MPVKRKQFLPQTEITDNNLKESLQLLYDLLGGEQLGYYVKDNKKFVSICGLNLQELPEPVEKEEPPPPEPIPEP